MEIHFFELAPVDHLFAADWYTTNEDIGNKLEYIATTQMGFLTTYLFAIGYRVFIHDKNKECYEIKLGNKNSRTNRCINMGNNLFKLWVNGEFNL